MPITLYKNPNGTVAPMLAPTQQQFEDCCCEPCGPCAGPLPAASVTLAGELENEWEAECWNLAGTYPFHYFHPEECWWSWCIPYSWAGYPGIAYLVVWYDDRSPPYSTGWNAYIAFLMLWDEGCIPEWAGGSGAFDGMRLPITCVDGRLTGEFTLGHNHEHRRSHTSSIRST